MKPKPRNMETSQQEAKVPSTPRKHKPICANKFKFDPPPEAPVFSPTLEEFENPLKYINKIRPIGQKTGICKIIPPAGWKVPFVLDMDSLKFTPRIQRINELEARTRIKLNFIDQLTKFFALKGKTFQIPVIEKRTLDLYTLHKLVKEFGGHDEVTKSKKWGEIAQKMELTNIKSPALLKTHYDHLILPFITSRLESEKNKEMGDSETLRDSNGNPIENSDSNSPALRELKSLTFLGPGPKMAVCDLAFTKSVKTRTRGKKIMYEFDPLAKYMCKSCSNGDIEESLVTCLSCEDRYHSSCLIPPLTDTNLAGWRCPKCVATEACKSLEEFGFAQAEREYTLTEFREMADTFKENYFKMKPTDVPTTRVESEFWKVVSSIEESVTVEYGADLHVIDHGSGFPIKNKPTKADVDNEVFNKYAESGWNLNNLPVLKASVLRHISADISGMKIPWMYAGMCFATFCWHNEDHWSYSINYLHLGEPKTWYGVPGSSAEDFERAMKAEAPELFDSQPDILHQLVTIMNPNDIMKTGVPIYRTDQREGEFVITFPRAYHAGFNQGFNFAEACNFAPYDWLHIGRECISHYSSLKRFCVFSHDELVCKMAEIYDELDKKILLATYKDMRTMVNAEHTKRKFLLMQGIKNASRVRFDELPDDERQCFVCKTTCFLSALVCKCNPLKLVCLDHYKQLCVCAVSNYKLKYHYKIDELVAILYLMRNKVENFDKWIVSVDKSFSDLNKKFYFRIFTELLIDSKDKEFTKEELLNVLEDQVKSCLQISSTAKTYLMNVNGDSTKNQKKKHINDLIKFSDNLNKVPCNLVESNSIKNLLECSLKLKKIAKKILNSKIINRARIDHCIRLMKAVNIDFEELSELEIKLLTCDWMNRYNKVISQPCQVTEIEDLIEKASTFPRTSLAYKQSFDLSKSLASVLSWKHRLDMAFSSPHLTPQDLRNLWSEQSDMLQVTFPEKERLAKILEQSEHINLQMKSLLSGEMVLYYEEIVKLIADAKLLPVCFPLLQQLHVSLMEASRWLSLAKKLFLKRSSPFDLMNALWPRKFVNRSNYYKRTNGVPYCVVESIFDVSGKKFSKRDFRQCYKTQIKSIFELRLQNSSITAKKSCPCGSELNSRTLECRICYTVYHSRCFIIEDKTSYPTLYNYFNKLICSFCFRTKRPHIDSIRELHNDLIKLAVKVPECVALEYSISKFNDWQNRAQKILSTKEIVSALQLINVNSKKILNSNSVQQLKNSAPPNSLIDLNIDVVQLINEEIKDFRHISVSNDKLIELRQLMMEGDVMEITSKESSDIWMLLEAAKMRDYFMATPSLFQPSTSKMNKNLVKTKLKVVKKCGMKSVRKNPNIKRIMRKTNMPTITNQNYLLKTKVLQAESLSSMPPSSPGASSVVSETGEDCAAENCLKPIEDNLDWVQCDGKCGQWFHMKCVDLTKQELSEDDEFLCLHCLGDEYLREFIGKVEHPGQMITLAAAQTLSVSEQLSKLAEGITLLDKELKKQVLEKHEDLVSQATWVEKLQGVLSVMHVHVQSLLSSVERVRMKVVEPFNRIESQTTVLSRLHATSDLLRRAARIQQLVKRLPGLDPLSTAHIISELGELYQDVDLSGLDILESEERQIKKERAAVEQKALKIVQQGLLGLDQNQVAIGIEIMIKLNIAEKEVNALMEEAIKQVKSSMKNALDMNVLVPTTTRGGAGRVSGVSIPTNIQYFRNKLWSSWEHALSATIYPMCCQMTLIQNVLNNKINDMCLSLPENEKKSDLAHIFWSEVDTLMKRSLLKAAEGSSYTKQALEIEYPKLLRMHLDFHKKLQTLNSAGSSKPIFPVIGGCLKDFETAYLSKSTNVILTSVREMFSEGKEATPFHPPSSDKIDALVKMISNELSVALVDSTLTEAVAKNVVAKAIKLFCQKAEEMIVTTPDASQVIETPNISQELNVNLANCVFYFSEQVKNVLNNLNVKKNIASCITNALQNGDKLTQEILNPLLASVIVAIDSILLTMHNEDYNLKEYNGSSSLYMRELQAFIARAATTYLSPFQNLTLVTQSCLEVSSRTLELFMRNATLVRPISIYGQKKLLSDFKSVEDAISPLCTQLSELGKVYRTLRSLKALVTAPISEVVASPVLGQVIPYSLIITFLISRGPPELPSPHQSVDWTIAAYSEWLDNHPDEISRLELLSGALQKYRKTICDQGKSTFDDMYPVIKSLLENATQFVSTKA